MGHARSGTATASVTGVRALRIVCLTSNAYHNCLEPFAHYWNRFAGAIRHVTVACYDAPAPALPDNFEVLRIGNQADFTWSSGLLKALDLLHDDVVLLMLEDYFLTEPVDWPPIDECADLVRYRTEILKIDLSDDRLKLPHRLHRPLNNGRLVENANDAPFQTSVQAALWKTDLLRGFLRADESAWQFEKQGTKRVIQHLNEHPHSVWIFGLQDPPMTYANAVGGAGGKPGVIEAKHMPEWMWDECLQKGWVHG